MRQVTVERLVHAPAQAIFDVLADPTKHPAIDGSGTVLGRLPAGAERLTLGAEFGMSMRLGLPYRVTNRVVEFDEGRLIAWAHVGRARWRYQLEPVEAGTRVRETWDYSRAPLPLAKLLELTGFPERNRAAMERTLTRLERLVTAD